MNINKICFQCGELKTFSEDQIVNVCYDCLCIEPLSCNYFPPLSTKFDIPDQDGITLKIKKVASEATIPKYAKTGDAGLDLVAVTKYYDEANKVIVFGTGLCLEIPKNHAGLIIPRSSIYKTCYDLRNSVGLIDSSFRGEVKIIMKAIEGGLDLYRPGDRIAQLLIIPYPEVTVEEVSELSDTERGSGGFGSSGR